ncbi:MAG: methylamine utilization protein [Acidobacteria bacterium]|nr:methylamine utilization protein [Acidobacteriota bacterium]MBV9474891.1 methylamine utilization protein [Acidobacteriota bacterium]
MHRSVTAVLALLLALPLAAATIDVQVSNAGGAAMSDAVVYAIPPHPIPVGHKVASMDQRDRTFIPHVLPIQTGTWVEFPNSDNVRHQVYSLSPAKRFQLPLYAGKPAYPVQFGTPGVVFLGCNIHEQMSAYVVVVDTPYFAKTEAGRASIAGLEPGQYTLHVWYPEMRKEPEPQIVTVSANDHPSVTFTAK